MMLSVIPVLNISFAYAVTLNPPAPSRGHYLRIITVKKLAFVLLIAACSTQAASFSDKVNALKSAHPVPAASEAPHPADRQAVSLHRINVQERDAALTELYRAMKVTHASAKDRRQMIQAGERATGYAVDTDECVTASRLAAAALVADNPTLDGGATANFFNWACRARISRGAL
jgi:hypothetical protein